MAQAYSSAVQGASSSFCNRMTVAPLLVGVVIVLAMSVFFVWTRQRVLNLEYEISSLDSGIRVARQEATKLQLEAAMLRQPLRIEQIARDEFGLTMPDPRQMIVVR